MILDGHMQFSQRNTSWIPREAEQRLLDYFMFCRAILAKLWVLEDSHRFKKYNFVFNTFSMFFPCKETFTVSDYGLTPLNLDF